MNEIEQLNDAVDKLGETVTALLAKVRLLEDKLAMMELAEQLRKAAAIPQQRTASRAVRRPRHSLTGPRGRRR